MADQKSWLIEQLSNYLSIIKGKINDVDSNAILLRQDIDNLKSLSGYYIGDYETVAEMPTTSNIKNGDYAILKVDDGLNKSGFYVKSTTGWGFVFDLLSFEEAIATLATDIQYNEGTSTTLVPSVKQVKDDINNLISDLITISLTTTGNNGAATYNNITGELNIPEYTIAGLAGSKLVEWDAAYSWGNHAMANYAPSVHGHDWNQISGVPTQYPPVSHTHDWTEINNIPGFITTESDPVFSNSPAFGIQNTDIANWGTAFNWGNHASVGYLTSFVEADPIFTAHIASSITNIDVATWGASWSRLGNTGTNPGPNFLGTLDYNDLVFKTDSNERLRIFATGNMSLGTDVNGGRMYIKAQGALSTDNTLRIRNSADNGDILNITGDGTINVTGTIKSFQSTGAKDLINHTRSDGTSVRLRTTNGYDVWLQPGNGGDMKLGDSTVGGASHATTIYGGSMYYTAPLISTNSVIIQRSGARYGVHSRPELDVEITDHNISGGGTATYCSNTILRGKTIVGYGSPITVTNASTLRIDQAPTAGANATLTNTWSLHVVAGASWLNGNVVVGGYQDPNAIFSSYSGSKATGGSFGGTTTGVYGGLWGLASAGNNYGVSGFVRIAGGAAGNTAGHGISGSVDSGNSASLGFGVRGGAATAGTNYALYGDATGGVNNYAIYAYRGNAVVEQGNLAIGTTTNGGRLYIKAQGALSTDNAFRIRNSADNADILNITGDANALLLGNMAVGSKTLGVTRDLSIGAYSNLRLIFDSGYNTTGANLISLTRRFGANYNDNTLLLQHSAFADGNVIPYKHHYVNPSAYYGYTNPGDALPYYGYDVGFIWFKDSAASSNKQMKLSPDNALNIYSSTNLPIETNFVDSFQLYSRDIVAGNSAPHFRTENGDVIKLYRETNAVSAGTLVSNGGTALTDTDTIDGYTLKQIVKALRNQGLLN